jgi:hypothetical protein
VLLDLLDRFCPWELDPRELMAFEGRRDSSGR